jgi:flagellar biosynthetic protein FliP
MMLPPVVVSLPFKLIFFVLVDGWSLVAGSLIQSYGNCCHLNRSRISRR